MNVKAKGAQTEGQNVVELYGGQVVLRLDRAKHRYFVAESGGTRQVPSVTQILGVLDKPGLLQWGANCAAEMLAERLRPGQALDEVELSQLADAIRFAHRQVSGRAKGVGALAHNWIESYLRWLILPAGRRERRIPSLPVNKEAHLACSAAKDWLNAHRFEPLAVEQMIYSRQYDYAGTTDFPSKIDGRQSVVDWKTSAAIYPEYRFQLAAYAEALREMAQHNSPDRWIVRLGKDDGAFEAVCLPREEQDADFRAFLAAKMLHGRLGELRNGQGR